MSIVVNEKPVTPKPSVTGRGPPASPITMGEFIKRALSIADTIRSWGNSADEYWGRDNPATMLRVVNRYVEAVAKEPPVELLRPGVAAAWERVSQWYSVFARTIPKMAKAVAPLLEKGDMAAAHAQWKRYQPDEGIDGYLREALDELSNIRFTEHKFKVGNFTFVDSHGLEQSHMQSWVEAFARVARLLKSKRLDYLLYGAVEIVPELRHTGAPRGWLGFYASSRDVLAINAGKIKRFLTVPRLTRVLIHELAHRLWYRFMDQAKRDTFSKYWLESDEVPESVTPYGRHDREEDFAETFTEVVMGTQKDRRLAERLQAVLPKGRVLSNVVAYRSGHGLDWLLDATDKHVAETNKKAKALDSLWAGRDAKALTRALRNYLESLYQIPATGLRENETRIWERLLDESKRRDMLDPVGDKIDEALDALERGDFESAEKLWSTRGDDKALRMLVDAVKKMKGLRFSREEFSYAGFKVRDLYGLQVEELRDWFKAMTLAVNALKAKGLDFLAQGLLTFEDLDAVYQAGGYNPHNDRLELNATTKHDVKERMHTIVHELGHRMWFKFMDAGARDKFSAQWIESGDDRSKVKTVTPYGRAHREEDFAELFATVVLGIEKSDEMKQKLQAVLPKGRVVSSTQVAAAPIQILRRRIDPKLGELQRFGAMLLEDLAAAAKYETTITKLVSAKRLDVAQLRAAVTAYRKALKKMLTRTPPSSLRPNEKFVASMTLSTLTSMSNVVHGKTDEIRKLLRSSSKRKDAANLWKRIASFSAKAQKVIAELSASNFIEPISRFGPFTLIDASGTPQKAMQPWFKAITHVIRLLKAKQLEHLLYGQLRIETLREGTAGLYYNRSDHITLSTLFRGTDDLVYTLVHELGHRLWYRFMDAGTRDRFAAPWVEQDERSEDLLTRMNQRLSVTKQQAAEGWKVLKGSKFSYSTFDRWLKSLPRPGDLAWLVRLEEMSSFTRSNERFTKHGELNQVAFREVQDHIGAFNIERSSTKSAARHKRIDTRRKRYIEKLQAEWMDLLTSPFESADLKSVLEPRSLKKSPTLLDQVMNEIRVHPSVTDYGQTNRFEDFAEVFTAVVLGREKDRAVQQRLQSVLRKGRVLSSTNAAAKEGAYWLFNNGKLVEADDTHAMYVEQNPKAFGLTEQDVEFIGDYTDFYYAHVQNLLPKDVVPKLFKKAMRIGVSTYSVSFITASPMTARHIKAAQDALTKLGVNLYRTQVVMGPWDGSTYRVAGNDFMFLKSPRDLKAVTAAATMTRTAAFKLFKEAVVELWNNGHKVVDRLQLSASKPKSKVYAALVMYPKKVKAVGNSIIYASPTYELQIADRLLEGSTELIRDIMRHEALHVGYPRHDRNFRQMATENNIPQTEMQTTDPGFKVQRKEGSRYTTIKTFEDQDEAMRWGKQQAREDREHRYRVVGSAVGQDWYGPAGQRYRIVQDTGDGWRVEIQHKSTDMPAEESWTFTKQQFERLKESLPLSSKANASVRSFAKELEARYQIKVDLSDRDEIIELSRIIVPPEQRGTGVGTKAMRDLCSYADQHDKLIALTPSSDFGGSKTRLVAFYKRFGFKPNKGRSKDFRTRETMIRQPGAPVTADAPSMPFKVGDEVLFGKYKNKRGRIVQFGRNPKGQVTVQIDPIPKGRKKTKEMGLFKIWTTPDAVEAVAATWLHYWMEPSGKLHNVKSHMSFVAERVGQGSGSAHKAWTEMIENGWVRISRPPGQTTIEVGKLTPQLMRRIQGALLEIGDKNRWVGIVQTSLPPRDVLVWVEMQDLLADGMKALRTPFRVTKAAAQTRNWTTADKVEAARWVHYWLDPQDTLHNVRTHMEFVAERAETHEGSKKAVEMWQRMLDEGWIRFSRPPGQTAIEVRTLTPANMRRIQHTLLELRDKNPWVGLVHGGKFVQVQMADLLADGMKALRVTKAAVQTRKNQDPDAQAFWRFVDKAAAEFDTLPEWMFHREAVAAVDERVITMDHPDATKKQKAFFELVKKTLLSRMGDNDKLLRMHVRPWLDDYMSLDVRIRVPWSKDVQEVMPYFKGDRFAGAIISGVQRRLGKSAFMTLLRRWPYDAQKAADEKRGARFDQSRERYDKIAEDVKKESGVNLTEWLKLKRRVGDAKTPQEKLRLLEEMEKLTATVTAANEPELYHTTSLGGMAKILQSRTFKHKNYDNPFISFSEKPYFGDISGNDAVIVLDRTKLRNRVMPVEYSESWYDRYPEHAAYVAGEGWSEQYQEPEECYDDEGWADDECLEQARRDAELESFLWKREEREWLSRSSGDLRLPADAFKRVVVPKPKLAAVEALIEKLGVKIPVKVLR